MDHHHILCVSSSEKKMYYKNICSFKSKIKSKFFFFICWEWTRQVLCCPFKTWKVSWTKKTEKENLWSRLQFYWGGFLIHNWYLQWDILFVCVCVCLKRQSNQSLQHNRYLHRILWHPWIWSEQDYLSQSLSPPNVTLFCICCVPEIGSIKL